MAEEPMETGEGGVASIRPTDIVFDCPYCTKSLAIDYRGAGLTIRCMDCGNNVIVPIPDGLDLCDLDSTEEEQEIRLVNLRRMLQAAEERAERMETRLAELGVSPDVSVKAETSDRDRIHQILEAVRSIQRAQDEIVRAIKAMAGSASGA